MNPITFEQMFPSPLGDEVLKPVSQPGTHRKQNGRTFPSPLGDEALKPIM